MSPPSAPTARSTNRVLPFPGPVAKIPRNPSLASGKRALFNWQVERGIRDVTEGTSNTAMLSEILVGPEGTYDIRGWWSNDWGGAYTHRLAPNSASGDIIPNYLGFLIQWPTKSML